MKYQFLIKNSIFIVDMSSKKSTKICYEVFKVSLFCFWQSDHNFVKSFSFKIEKTINIFQTFHLKKVNNITILGKCTHVYHFLYLESQFLNTRLIVSEKRMWFTVYMGSLIKQNNWYSSSKNDNLQNMNMKWQRKWNHKPFLLDEKCQKLDMSASIPVSR